ncbi:MAG: TetR/AcrR family transcriptional regulator [Desulfobulbaceae bacterium]|nr:TetR/AcrR family transcriptional regulator [Desulfobulbaceae bacterium]
MANSEKRQEILNAALELITEHGFHGAPIAAIAQRAGVGAGTIYRYFATKDILIIELFQELHDKICEYLMEGYEEEQPFRTRFLHLSTALLRYFITNPQEFRYLEQYFNSPYGVEFRRDKILKSEGDGMPYRVLFEEGMRQQVVRDLPVVVLFALTFGPLLAVARDHILGFVDLDERLLVQTVEACWDSVKVCPMELAKKNVYPAAE